MLSKACSYGLRAAILLAGHTNTTYKPIKELSDALGVSFHFLTKILQQLTEAGILESQKGPRGGVALVGDPELTSVYDIVTAIDGLRAFEECILALPGCGVREPCPLHSQWAEERLRIARIMKMQSIAELARDASQRNLRLGDIG